MVVCYNIIKLTYLLTYQYCSVVGSFLSFTHFSFAPKSHIYNFQSFLIQWQQSLIPELKTYWFSCNRGAM